MRSSSGKSTDDQETLALMLAAGINMLVFQFVTYRGVAAWDRDRAVPLAGKLAGLISLAVWIAVVVYVLVVT